MKRPEIEFDDGLEICTINGQPFSYALLEAFGRDGLPAGKVVRLHHDSEGALVFSEERKGRA